MSQCETILSAIGTLLATMRVSSGYSSNGGLNLHEGLSHPLENEPLPAYAWDASGSDGDDAEEIGRWEHTLSISVEACASGDDCKITARRMVEDVITALGIDDTLGGTVEKINPPSWTVGVTQKENKIASGLLTFSVIYRTERFAL